MRALRITMHAIGLLLVLAFAVIAIVPIYWTVSTSFQPNAASVKIPPEFIPSVLTLDNYKHIFSTTSALRWFWNSTLVAVVSTFFVVYFSALAGYPLAKRKFPGVKLLFWIVLAFLTIPREVLLLPLFMMMRDLFLYDSYLALILPAIAWPFGVFLMKQFISTIPTDIFDAAEIDGCTPFSMFHRILLPMIKPAIGALTVFAFVHGWNDFIWQLIILSSDGMKTLPLGVASLSDEFVTNYGYVLAGASFGALPLLIIFIAFQRFFTGGITLGAVKG